MRQSGIEVYNLPLVNGAKAALTISSPLPVLGGGSLTFSNLSDGGVATNETGTRIWVADPWENRVFRVRNPLTAPVVDIVLGQTSASGADCNQGRGELTDAPTRDSLCYPGAVALDRQGNLYVSDDAAEVRGNFRLLEYDAGLFPDEPASALFAIPATRVFGTGGSFTLRPFAQFTGWQELPTCAFEPAFSSTGQMVVGGNGGVNPPFPYVYTNPLVDQHVGTMLNDFYSWPDAATFDSDDNLYVVDGDRSRVMVYLKPLPNPPPPVVTLTVTKAGNGTGRVQSIPFGIDCSPGCSMTTVKGAIVSLIALPDPGISFDGWSGDAGCASGVVTLNADARCTANFSDPHAGLKFFTATPCRILDTRNAAGPLGGPALQPGATRTFNAAASSCGLPADALAISANLTVTNVGAPGELVVFSSDVPRPNATALSFRTGRTRANNAIISLSKSSASFSVFNSSGATVDFIVDVNGFFR